MTVSSNIKTTGTIIQKHGGDYYQVRLTNGQEILCRLMSRFRIPSAKGKGKRRPQITVGDKVQVEIDVRDFNKGMIVGFA